MSTSVGAQDRPSSDDSVLASALSEMSTEGSIQADATLGDLDSPAPAASQDAGAASAAPEASDPSPATGDDGAAPQSAAPKADDPLAGTEPFTYGEGKKVLDGVYRVPGEGLLVPEDRVPVIQQLAERAEALATANADLNTERSTFERLSSWTVTDAQGKEQTLTGLQGLEAMRVSHGTTKAAFEVLADIFKPNEQGEYPRLLQLLAVQQVPDGRGGTRERVTINPDALSALLDRSEAAEMRAEQAARSRFGDLSKAPPPPALPVNFAKEGPRLIEQVAKESKLDASVLTPKMREQLAAQLKFHTQNGTVSTEWQDLVREAIADRAEALKAQAAAEKAGKLNAGMDKGRQPQKQAAKAPTTPAQPKQNERKRADWNAPLESALSEMGIARSA